MQVFRGKGKIYDSSEHFVDEVTYEIHLKSNDSAGAVWWGEITPQKDIMPVGNYIIELEDGRRGPCVTRMNTYSSFGLVVDSFNLEGTGPLT
jgi:hypothetical protein